MGSVQQLGVLNLAQLRLDVFVWQEEVPLAIGERLSIYFLSHTATHSLRTQTFYFLNRYCLFFALIGWCASSSRLFAVIVDLFMFQFDSSRCYNVRVRTVHVEVSYGDTH